MAAYDIPSSVMFPSTNQNDGMLGGGGMGFILGLLFGRGGLGGLNGTGADAA